MATLKLLEEKNVDKGISHFVWSPKMDIIAVASEQNDTSLYRLNFQKVSLSLLEQYGPPPTTFPDSMFYFLCIRFGQQNRQT